MHVWQEPLRALLSVLRFLLHVLLSRCPSPLCKRDAVYPCLCANTLRVVFKSTYLVFPPPTHTVHPCHPYRRVHSFTEDGNVFTDSRTVHRSKPKKAALDADEDDLFAFEDSDELIPLGSTADESAPSSSHTRTKSTHTTDYAAKFAEHLQFLSDHNGKAPAVRDGKQVADSIWLHLLGNARSQEDLEKVAKQFRPWKDAGREIKPRVVDLFVRAFPPFII